MWKAHDTQINKHSVSCCFKCQKEKLVEGTESNEGRCYANGKKLFDKGHLSRDLNGMKAWTM